MTLKDNSSKSITTFSQVEREEINSGRAPITDSTAETNRMELLAGLFFSATFVSSMPLEPIYEKHLTGTPIKGSYFPIGPGTDEGLFGSLFEGDILIDPADGKNAVSDLNLLWPSGAVIYKIDDGVGCPDSPQCEILTKAIDHYHVKSCIRFKEWSGEQNYVRIFFNTKESGACWSPVGRVGNGEQKLSLGHRCWYFGIVVHELGHSIGFWHEMNRPDRDDWIYVFWSNILPNYASAFNKQDLYTVNTLGEQFDFESIMMYDEYAFSKDGQSPTLQSKLGNEIGPIWKKPGLSDSDLRRLHKLYQCEGRKPKDGFPYNTTCDFNLHTCGFKNGGSAVWNWRTVNDTDGYVYSSYENSGTTPGFLMSINFHKTSDPLNSPLGCVRFWYLIQEDTIAYLKLNQAFLERVTQLQNDPETTFELWYNDTSEGQWVHVAVPLYVTRPFKLIFEAEFAEDNKDGTIALDDVEMLYKECSVEGISNVAEAETTDSKETSDRPLIRISLPLEEKYVRTAQMDYHHTEEERRGQLGTNYPQCR